MSRSTHSRSESVERAETDLSTEETVWMGAPRADGDPDPERVELFASRENAERYVESLPEAPDEDRDWVSRSGEDGRYLVEAEGGDRVGVVCPFETTVPGEVPPFDDTVLERLVPPESRLRTRLGLLNDRPTVDRDALPLALFDVVLFSERGHLQLQVGDADGRRTDRCLDVLTTYAGKTVSAGKADADDRVARSRIEDLNDYVRVEDGTCYYGKPRYRLAKKLSDWGGDTGRYACLELWLLFRLLLRLYPEHVSWEEGYGYHDDH